MELRDLGRLNGPVLLFGGPYSNLCATQAVIARGRALGIAPERMICTGDLVAYCAQAAETVAEIRALGCPVVAGNCEKQLAQYQMNCGCGFEAGTECDLLSRAWYAHADAAIGAADRRWMGALPDMIVFRHHDRRCAVVHGGATDISRFLWPVSPEAEFEEEISFIQSLAGRIDVIISGHSGVPFQRRIGETLWVNAGAIGMPPNDGRPETRFALLDRAGIVVHELRYDHLATRDAMRAAGLTQGYDGALIDGYWPSEGVLPPALRRAAVASG
ncbi:metallophosphoesterase family protein [Roseovarius sp.]|uniref:metallophosphoesterase family protein n=1 Tax=Roseovarius sp. TaxID=1486281 RepID=UPI002604D17E|nr:metallophosphoesterase family protein [Roseovarius sp.]